MSITPNHPAGNPSRKSIACLLVWLLALSLVLSQALGLVHGVAHSGAKTLTTAAAYGAVNRPQVQNSLQSAGKGTLASLFSSHNSSADCRLYDQASHGSAALHVVFLALPVVLPAFVVAIFHGEALARWVALFDARGPPLTF